MWVEKAVCALTFLAVVKVYYLVLTYIYRKWRISSAVLSAVVASIVIEGLTIAYFVAYE